MSKVYVCLLSVDYEGVQILDIFSSLEDANNCAKQQLISDYRVEEGRFQYEEYFDDGKYIGTVADLTYYVEEFEVKQMEKDKELIISILMNDFEYDLEQAEKWYTSKNYQFGGASPEQLVDAGRANRALQFLRAVQEGYQMEDNNLVSLKGFILKKDLEAFSQALLTANLRLQVENEELKNKLAHLEELIKNSKEIPIIGG